MRALRDALSQCGEHLPGTSAIPPGVNTVHGDRWRSRYFALDVIDTDGSEDDAKASARARDTRLKRFTRARKALQEAGMVGGINDLWWLS